MADAVTTTEIVTGVGGDTLAGVFYLIARAKKVVNEARQQGDLALEKRIASLESQIEKMRERNEQQDAATAAARERTGQLVTAAHNRINPLSRDLGRLEGRAALTEGVMLTMIGKGKGGKE